MNPRMWSHPATRANAETLRARGVVLVGPDEGETAEGELGVGRMAEPEDIVQAAEELLAGIGPLARQARADQRRRDARADRRGALRRQSLVGPHGRRARRRRPGGAART